MIETEVKNKSELTGVHTMLSAGVLSHSVLLICVSPYHWDLRWFKFIIRSTRLASNETCPVINRTMCFTLALCHTEILFFFSLDSSQDVSSSRGTNGNMTQRQWEGGKLYVTKFMSVSAAMQCLIQQN